jgi:hypothetical protein
MISLYRHENKVKTLQNSNADYQVVILKSLSDAVTPLKQLDSDTQQADFK